MRGRIRNHRRPTGATTRGSAVVLLLAAAGCASSAGLGERGPIPAAELAATTRPDGPRELAFATFAVLAEPPVGWTQRTNSLDERSEHVTWISPSGATAYGTLFFKIPFPVGHEFAFQRGFLAEVRKREGEPVVLEKYWDEQIGGLRFTVRSPKYQIECKFFVKGLRGYAVYAGTRADRPTDEAELNQARAARESTRFLRELTATSRPADIRPPADSPTGN